MKIKEAIKKAKKWLRDIEKDGLDLGGCPPVTYEEEAYSLLSFFINYFNKKGVRKYEKIR